MIISIAKTVAISFKYIDTKITFLDLECVRMCVCVYAWEGVPDQCFVSHSLGVVNNVVLKTCEVRPRV